MPIENFTSPVAMTLDDLKNSFQHVSSEHYNILIIYNIVFRCPNALPQVAFRLKINEKYVPGSMAVSRADGEIRSVNGIGYYTAKNEDIFTM